MGGNVYQQNDAVIGAYRGLRGGEWHSASSSVLASSTRGYYDPSSQSYGVGFRVASVPEPTTVVLTMLASGVLVMRRKR